eukprot:6101479-Amphidinium_carterae.1
MPAPLPVKQTARPLTKRPASLDAPSLVAPPGQGVLLVEQEAHGLAQKMRAQKAKAAAKSSEVGELATAILQGMQSLGDRLAKLESGMSGTHVGPPPPKATTV